MTPEQDPYYGRPEISNSDLGILAKYWQALQISYDIDAALRFGTLFDCMLTEKQRVDYYKFTCCGWTYTRGEFAVAEAMVHSFMRDAYCAHLLRYAVTQTVLIDKSFLFEYLGFKFRLPFRGKVDFDARKILRLIADLKSTTATTEKEFRKMIEAFSYDRQAAAYMDLGNTDQFMLIGVSKLAPYTVFKVPIIRGDKIYLAGRAKLDELGFRHFTLFSHLKIAI